VLAGLGTARSAQLQASCLTLLRALVRAHPAAAALAVRVLGALLASPAMAAQVAMMRILSCPFASVDATD